MTNHMHVAGYFPEPYDGRIKFGEKDYSIAEMATSRELPPILYRRGDWVVTTEGIDCLVQSYEITKDRLDETDWIPHMREKTWVNMEDFSNALATARDFVRLGII